MSEPTTDPDDALHVLALPGLGAGLDAETAPSPADLGFGATGHAANTLRGYRFDDHAFATWCAERDLAPLPAAPTTVVAYLTDLAATGTRLTTMSRRMSSLAFAHRRARRVDPTRHPDVRAAWDAIRRAAGDEPDHSAPLLPPELFDVVNACPRTKEFARREPEPSLRGARDRALLLVGFVGALRRSELVALDVADIAEHPDGLTLVVRGGPLGTAGEQVVLPRARYASRCPVRALQYWLDVAGIVEGPVFRGVTKANRAAARPLHPESVNSLVQQAVERAGIPPEGYTAHSLRAGFVTYSQLLGIDDRSIARQTRHRVLESVTAYARRSPATDDADPGDAATEQPE